MIKVSSMRSMTGLDLAGLSSGSAARVALTASQAFSYSSDSLTLTRKEEKDISDYVEDEFRGRPGLLRIRR